MTDDDDRDAGRVVVSPMVPSALDQLRQARWLIEEAMGRIDSADDDDDEKGPSGDGEASGPPTDRDAPGEPGPAAPSIDRREFGRRLREARMRAGFSTTRAAARRVGWRESDLAYYERGDRALSALKLHQLVLACHLDLGILFPEAAARGVPGDRDAPMMLSLAVALPRPAATAPSEAGGAAPGPPPRRRGRPAGKRDSKPRKKKAASPRTAGDRDRDERKPEPAAPVPEPPPPPPPSPAELEARRRAYLESLRRRDP